ncbi:MAG: UPF0149 family protein [Gammaproteobacteria bacterium]|nr:UPF0149 family protein [Gammaproteobacteria bacterium]
MEYDQIDDALKRSSIQIDAAEAHGMLSGLLSTMDEEAKIHWQTHCFPDQEMGDLLVQESMVLLEPLIEETEQQLQSSNFLFYPLLPDEEASLESRIEALAHWCQGFMLGLSVGGIVDNRKLPGELPEFVDDMVEFSRAESFSVEGEDDENTYTELVEYIRMGVLLFHEEIRSLKEKAGNSTVH